MDKSALLDRLGAVGEERLLLARILDRQEQATRRGTPVFTDFLTPQQQLLADRLLMLCGAGPYVSVGGYEGAQRKILLFLPDWLEEEAAPEYSPIRLLRAVYRDKDAEINHRDLLGSLMHLGVAREKIGDILVGPDSTDVLVLESIGDFLLQNWSRAGRTALTVQAAELCHIHIPVQEYREIRSTVSALRLDAVLSSAFPMSRSRAAELIASGRVQINWQECLKSDRTLAEGDTLSVRGFGRAELTEVGGITRKGRRSIVIRQYQ